MKRLRIFGVGLIVTALSACVNLTAPATETEAALCEAWGRSLPTRSRQDTQQTRDEIQVAYADFLNGCPDYGYLIPKGAMQ
jgi:hypothetical protein